jgi:uncharacterized protein
MKSLFHPLALCLILAACSDAQTPLEAEHTLPLLNAAETGDLPAIRHLIGSSSPIDERDACLWTPLMKAALNGHTEAVRLLIEAGADVNLRDKGGYTPLMLAASNNHVAVLDLLIMKGAHLDLREQTGGFTALIWAAKLGHIEAVRRLLASGADRSICDFEGKRAIDQARKMGRESIIALLDQAPE